MSIYLHIQGLQGNVSTQDYKNWINIHDLDFAGVTRPSNITWGETTGRNHNIPRLGEITVIKDTDTVSNTLLQAIIDAKVFPKFEFHRVTEGSPNTVYGKIILSNVIVTHYSNKQHSNSTRPQDLIRLSYTQLQQTVIPISHDNRSRSPHTTGIDIEKAQKM
jgi:type VI secretion system Hcp family effector